MQRKRDDVKCDDEQIQEGKKNKANNFKYDLHQVRLAYLKLIDDSFTRCGGGRGLEGQEEQQQQAAWADIPNQKRHSRMSWFRGRATAPFASSLCPGGGSQVSGQARISIAPEL